MSKNNAAMALAAFSGIMAGVGPVSPSGRNSGYYRSDYHRGKPATGPIDTGGNRQRRSKGKKKKARAKSLSWKGGK